MPNDPTFHSEETVEKISAYSQAETNITRERRVMFAPAEKTIPLKPDEHEHDTDEGDANHQHASDDSPADNHETPAVVARSDEGI